jgi:hypothetical protein
VTNVGQCSKLLLLSQRYAWLVWKGAGRPIRFPSYPSFSTWSRVRVCTAVLSSRKSTSASGRDENLEYPIGIPHWKRDGNPPSEMPGACGSPTGISCEEAQLSCVMMERPSNVGKRQSANGHEFDDVCEYMHPGFETGGSVVVRMSAPYLLRVCLKKS